MELAGKPVVVVGLARSGIAAAGFLARPRGARRGHRPASRQGELPAEALSAARRAACASSWAATARRRFAARRRWSWSRRACPGTLPELAAARARGRARDRRSWSWAFRYIAGPVAAVTGTKGKSTTTAALGAMLREAGRDVRVGGNIGRRSPASLEGATERHGLRARGVELPARGHRHLPPAGRRLPEPLRRPPRPPRRASRTTRAAKARIFAQPDRGRLGGRERATTRRCWRWRAAARARAGAVRVRGAPLATRDGAFFDAATPLLRLRRARGDALPPRRRARCPASTSPCDLLAAATAARLHGRRPRRRSRARCARFAGVEHVLERVAEIGGVAFFNDSKATNVDAARKSLEAFAGPVLAILGGRYKGGDFAELRARAGARTAGRCWPSARRGERVARRSRSAVPVVRLREPARRRSSAPSPRPQPGDTVLLAPGLLVLRHVHGLRRARPRLQGRGARLARSAARSGAWLRSSPPTSRCFAVTRGPARARPGDGVERVVGARPGAPRQRLLLPGPPGGLGLRSGLVGMVAAMRLDYRKLRQPAVVYSVVVGHHAAADRGAVPAAGERHPPLDPPGRALASSRRSWPSSRSSSSSPTTWSARRDRVNEFLPSLFPALLLLGWFALPDLHPARPRHRRHPRPRRRRDAVPGRRAAALLRGARACRRSSCSTRR